MISKLIFLLFFLPLLGHSQLMPQPHSQLGDVDYAYLNKPGVYLQTLNNDFIGNTDKHLTHSTGVSYFGIMESTGYEISIFRRLFTPALNKYFSAPRFPSPVGVLVDDTVVRFSWGWQYKQFEIYPEVSLHSVGNHNARNVYNFVHGVIGSDKNFDEFGKEKTGNYISTGLKVSRSFNFFWLGGGYLSSPLMEDAYLLMGVKLPIKHLDIESTFQIKYVFQSYSVFYEKFESQRQHFQLGVRHGSYILYIAFNSRFLKDDPQGQWHIAPLNFHFTW